VGANRTLEASSIVVDLGSTEGLTICRDCTLEAVLLVAAYTTAVRVVSVVAMRVHRRLLLESEALSVLV